LCFSIGFSASGINVFASPETIAEVQSKNEIVRIHNDLKQYKLNNTKYESAMSKEEVE